MFGSFYNSSLRRYIVMMGDLFSHIQVMRPKDDAVYLQKVPISYGSKEKFMAKLDKLNSINSKEPVAKVETILPRINLNMIDLLYNPTFKTNIANVRTQTQSNGTNLISQYNPVPIKMIFELGIYTRHQDDMFQIVEQIYPYFQPHFTTKIIELFDHEIKFERDIRVVIRDTMIDHQFEGDANSRRHLEWNIMFEVNGWLYPPVADIKGEIRTIFIDFFSNRRELNPEGSFDESIEISVQPDGVKKEDWEKDPQYKIEYESQHGD